MACFTENYHAAPGKVSQEYMQEYMDHFDVTLDLAASDKNRVYVYTDERIEHPFIVFEYYGD